MRNKSSKELGNQGCKTNTEQASKKLCEKRSRPQRRKVWKENRTNQAKMHAKKWQGNGVQEIKENYEVG